MTLPYIIDHIPLSTPHRRRPGTRLVPKGITIHSTGNQGSTARAERNWLVNPTNKRAASYHIVVDDKEAIEVVPLNEVSHHGGTFNNLRFLGIEICESGDRQQTIQNAVLLLGRVLSQFSWNTAHLNRHRDRVRTACPSIFPTDVAWQEFIERVRIQMTNQVGRAEGSSGGTPLVAIPAGMEKWQFDMGREALQELNQEGLISDIPRWMRELNNPMPSWMVWVMLVRILRKR